MNRRILPALASVVLLALAVALLPGAAPVGRVQRAFAADGTCYQIIADELREYSRSVIDPSFCVAAATETATATATGTATATATATNTPTNTPVGAQDNTWHGPTDHEHGDAPPAWVNQWIAQNAAVYGSDHLIYGGDETTSPMEQGMKHAAFKGVLMASPAGTTVYLRYHAAANPMDRSAQFHSYEAWWRDTRGGVSFLQGWYDTGNPAPYPQGNRIPRRLGDPGRRPVMLVVDQQTQQQLGSGTCEQWYMFAALRLADFAVTICGVPYLYNANENATAHDQGTWQRNPSGGFGLHRRAESFFFRDRLQGVSGAFYATPMGQPCTAGTAGCLYQYIAPTLARDARAEFGVTRISTLIEKDFQGGPNIGPIN